MFATYGEFVFETIFSPEDFESTRDYNYAEHKVVEDISRLQWVGDDTEQLDIEGLFHFQFCNPKAEIEALYAAAEDHNARALVYGSGEFRGYFVIKQIVATYQLFSGDGVLAATRFKLILKGIPIKELFNQLKPPPLGHQPWAVVESDTGSTVVIPSQTTVVDPKAADGTFGFTPTTGFSPSLLLPAGGEGTSAISSNPTPTGPPSAEISPSEIPPTSIVRSE